jgi:hypothetical protein
MSTFNLQTLELRAASLTGARATGQGSTALFVAGLANPAEALSLPRHPLPGHLSRIGLEPVGGHRGYSMEPLGRRAGRSARSAGGPGQIGFARTAGRTILSSWSVSAPAAVNPVTGIAGCPGGNGKTPSGADYRNTGYSCSLQRWLQACADVVIRAKSICG